MEEKTNRPAVSSKIAAVFFNGSCDLPLDFFLASRAYESVSFFAADGGAEVALRYGIKPELVIGDMDSIHPETQKLLTTNNCQFVTYPTNKDKSDGELLIEYLSGKNFDSIHIFAATGGRIDQTLINIQLASRFPRIKFITATQEIFCVTDKHEFEMCQNQVVSLIPTVPQAHGISLRGFKYPLENFDITYGSSHTLSNEITEKRAVIEIKKGAVLIVRNF